MRKFGLGTNIKKKKNGSSLKLFLDPVNWVSDARFENGLLCSWCTRFSIFTPIPFRKHRVVTFFRSYVYAYVHRAEWKWRITRSEFGIRGGEGDGRGNFDPHDYTDFDLKTVVNTLVFSSFSFTRFRRQDISKRTECTLPPIPDPATLDLRTLCYAAYYPLFPRRVFPDISSIYP